MDLITFNNELSSLILHIPKYNVLISTVAQIGKDENNTFCLHNFSNKNGEYLADFSLGNSSLFLNIKIKKGRGKYGLTR